MDNQLEVVTVDEAEGYLAPDVVRLGTAEALTAGTADVTNLGDAASVFIG